MLDGIDPGPWVDAIAKAVKTLPWGQEIFLALAAGAVLRWLVLPLLRFLVRR